MRSAQSKRLLRNLIIADAALEIVEDTPTINYDVICQLMEQKVLV